MQKQTSWSRHLIQNPTTKCQCQWCKSKHHGEDIDAKANIMVKTCNWKPNDKTTTSGRHISVPCNTCQAPSLAQHITGENTSEAPWSGCMCLFDLLIHWLTHSTLTVCPSFWKNVNQWNLESWIPITFGALEHRDVNDVHSPRPLKFHAIYTVHVN